MLFFLIVVLGYTLIYLGYLGMVKTPIGRNIYIIGVVVGTWIGSTIGARLFE